MKSFLFTTVLLIIAVIGFAFFSRQNTIREKGTDAVQQGHSIRPDSSAIPDPSHDEISLTGRKIVSLVTAIPGIRIKQSEGIVIDHRLHRKGNGKKIVITGSVSSFANERYPDSILRDKLSGCGWKEDLTYAADGPDGNSFAFRNGPVLCLFNTSWDSGKTGNTTDKADNSYSLTIQYAQTSDLEIIP